MGDGGVIGMAGFQPTACADYRRSRLPLPPELASAGPCLLSWLLQGPQHAVLAWTPLCPLPLLQEAKARTGIPQMQASVEA